MTVAANGTVARSETPGKKKKKWSHAQESPIVVNLSHVVGLSRRKLLSWEAGSGAGSGITMANSKLAGRNAGRAVG